jgi:HPt (histidine-containing phosphotransfer) domain-containing protein
VEHINIEEALLRLGGNAQIFKSLLKKFISNPYYTDLCLNMNAGNLTEAKHNAHTIKGTAGNLGLTALYHSATLLDDTLKEGDDSEDAFESFKTIYRDTIEAINNYIT